MDLSVKVPLGRTGLMVSRLGLGSGYMVPEEACIEAFDAGLNYFYVGSGRGTGITKAVRRLSSRHRDQMVIVLQSYCRGPRWLERSIELGLRKLRLDSVDILLLGWHDSPPSPQLLDRVQDLRERGLFRFTGISSHNRRLFQKFIGDPRFGVIHLRYNAAHPGAETDVFPHLGDKGPGVVSFTNTRWGDLLKPKNMPAGDSPPTARDCYRFALSDPHVHVALCGPRNLSEMREALTVLESSSMEPEEIVRLRRIGQHVHGIPNFMSLI